MLIQPTKRMNTQTRVVKSSVTRMRYFTRSKLSINWSHNKC